MSEVISTGGHCTSYGCTGRTDRWWMTQVFFLVFYGAFVTYTTWAALQGQHYYAEPYLSPMYSPPLFVTDAPGSAPIKHSVFGQWPDWLWLPAFVPMSPAIFILVFPGIFRFTCYYHRNTYYRAFASTPPACGVVGLKRKNYPGETKWLLFQNLHRYTMYIAVIYIGILSYDAWLAFWMHNGDGYQFGVGVGSLLLVFKTALLACYTLGCHSLRHLVGGMLNLFSGRPVRFRTWAGVTWLNERHGEFALLSMFFVAFADLYIRLVSMEVWHDFNTWNF